MIVTSVGAFVGNNVGTIVISVGALDGVSVVSVGVDVGVLVGTKVGAVGAIDGSLVGDTVGLKTEHKNIIFTGGRILDIVCIRHCSSYTLQYQSWRCQNLTLKCEYNSVFFPSKFSREI